MVKSKYSRAMTISVQPTGRRFGFEADTKCLRCTSSERLDRLKLKIGRAQWLAITDQERLAIWPGLHGERSGLP